MGADKYWWLSDPGKIEPLSYRKIAQKPTRFLPKRENRLCMEQETFFFTMIAYAASG